MEEEAMSAGGIVIPDAAKEKPRNNNTACRHCFLFHSLYYKTIV
jgi:hypothetical protein